MQLSYDSSRDDEGDGTALYSPSPYGLGNTDKTFLRVGVGAVAADRSDVELVVASLLAVERIAHAQPGLVLVYYHYLRTKE